MRSLLLMYTTIFHFLCLSFSDTVLHCAAETAGESIDFNNASVHDTQVTAVPKNHVSYLQHDINVMCVH